MTRFIPSRAKPPELVAARTGAIPRMTFDVPQESGAIGRATILLGCAPGERFNTLTHLVALTLSLVGGAMLLLQVWKGGSPLKLASAVVFGLTLVLLYGSSVLFHWTSGPRKAFWERADHACIYLLIAGTFTPYGVVGALGVLHWLIFAAMWGLASWGMVQQLRTGSSSAPPLGLYLGMGWLAVIAAVPVAVNHSGPALAWLLVGGLAYSTGIFYYRNPMRRPHAHGIWHLFVLAGSASHFASIHALLA